MMMKSVLTLVHMLQLIFIFHKKAVYTYQEHIRQKNRALQLIEKERQKIGKKGRAKNRTRHDQGDEDDVEYEEIMDFRFTSSKKNGAGEGSPEAPGPQDQDSHGSTRI
eukprot:m.186247 g.186247  ORF g.186247 m.186247 type:complete len:108 (+) comp15589_c0_seq1:77-400(+)